MPAELDINGREVNNAQILIAGATGPVSRIYWQCLFNNPLIVNGIGIPGQLSALDYKGEFADRVTGVGSPILM
jgi:hypothetical protein